MTQTAQASVHQPQTSLSHLLLGAASHECQSFAKLNEYMTLHYYFILKTIFLNVFARRMKDLRRPHTSIRWRTGHLVISTGNETEWPELWSWLWSQRPGRPIWRETVVPCPSETLYTVSTSQGQHPHWLKKKKDSLEKDKPSRKFSLMWADSLQWKIMVFPVALKGVASRIWCL